jgi:hypothetical protein
MTVSKVLNLATGEYLPSVVVGTDFTQVGGGATPPAPDPDGPVTNEKLQYDLPELSLPPVITDIVGPSVSAVVPNQTDTFELAAVVKDSVIAPVPVEAVNVNIRIVKDDNYPTPVTTNTLVVDPVVNDVDTLIDLTVITANYSSFARDVQASTNWNDPNNVLGDTTATATTLRATASGIAGTTNNTTTGSITVNFRDVEYGNLEVENSIILVIESRHQTVGIAIAQPTTTVEFQYSVGSGFTTFHTQVINTAKALFSVDLTSVINKDPALIDALQVRAVGSVTSGTGLNVASFVSFFRTRLQFTAEGEFT